MSAVSLRPNGGQVLPHFNKDDLPFSFYEGEDVLNLNCWDEDEEVEAAIKAWMDEVEYDE